MTGQSHWTPSSLHSHFGTLSPFFDSSPGTPSPPSNSCCYLPSRGIRRVDRSNKMWKRMSCHDSAPSRNSGMGGMESLLVLPSTPLLPPPCLPSGVKHRLPLPPRRCEWRARSLALSLSLSHSALVGICICWLPSLYLVCLVHPEQAQHLAS
jgi:hypothetical protein